MIIYTEGSVEVRTGTPTPPVLDQAMPAIIYGDSVEVRAPVPQFHPEPINLRQVLCPQDWAHMATYDRLQRFRVLSAATEIIRFNLLNFGVARLNLPIGEYHLTDDETGQTLSTVTISTTLLVGQFSVSTASLQERYYRMRILGPNLRGIAVWMAVDKGSWQQPSQVPVQSGSFDIHYNSEPNGWTMLPASHNPRIIPLTPRSCPHFNTALPQTEMVRTNVVVVRDTNITRPNVTTGGVMTNANRQAYDHSVMIKRWPLWSLLDGPRGRGSLMTPTHIMLDRHSGAYCLDPWRVVRVSQEGVVKTRCGYVQDDPPGHYDGAEVLLVPYANAVAKGRLEEAADILEDALHRLRIRTLGDWMPVRNFRRFLVGFHETWGGAWWKATLDLDPNAPPIDGAQPHLNGPQLFVTGLQNNAVYRLTFKKDNFAAEPLVSIFHADLANSFDCIELNGVVYVSERDANRISTFNALTGARIDTLLITPMPEGLFYYDGWLYFSARNGSVDPKIRRIHLITTTVEDVCVCRWDTNSRFIKFAVNTDGTFGPAGTVFYVTWSIGNGGYPRAVLPDGTEWKWTSQTNNAPVAGRGGVWDPIGYGSACAVGDGRIYCGSSSEGLQMISKAIPGDVIVDRTKWGLGNDEWERKAYRMIHGDYGYGHHGFPSPYGESANLDYWLQVNGL